MFNVISRVFTVEAMIYKAIRTNFHGMNTPTYVLSALTKQEALVFIFRNFKAEKQRFPTSLMRLILPSILLGTLTNNCGVNLSKTILCKFTLNRGCSYHNLSQWKSY